MAYTVLSASKYISKLKATIHTSGKLGFSDNTAKTLGFDKYPDCFVQFAQDDDNPSILYLINRTNDDGDSFKVCKSGLYYFVNAKLMFDALGIDYANKTIIFDMIKLQEENNEVYKMIKRELDKQKKD